MAMTTCSAKIAVHRVRATASTEGTEKRTVAAPKPADDQQSRRALLGALAGFSAATFARSAVAATQKSTPQATDRTVNGIAVPVRTPLKSYVYTGTTKAEDAKAGTGGFKNAGGLFGCDSGFGCYNGAKEAEGRLKAKLKAEKAAAEPAPDA